MAKKNLTESNHIRYFLIYKYTHAVLENLKMSSKKFTEDELEDQIKAINAINITFQEAHRYFMKNLSCYSVKFMAQSIKLIEDIIQINQEHNITVTELRDKMREERLRKEHERLETLRLRESVRQRQRGGSKLNK